MKPFMDSDFLLQTDTAKKLYHDYAKQVPVLDYHCHLVPKEIAEDIHFKNMTELWLGADHYKWRVMRSNGVDEYFITGDAPDEEKFHAFAKALPNCIGNPMLRSFVRQMTRLMIYIITSRLQPILILMCRFFRHGVRTLR